jgi:hypothetical protein
MPPANGLVSFEMRRLTNQTELKLIDNFRRLLLFPLKIRRPFFRSYPQFFHIATRPKPAPDKPSSLHWNCQLFSAQYPVAQPAACDCSR